MKNQYGENFDGIQASEEKKQKPIDTLNKYLSGAARTRAVKKQKRFKWSMWRIAVEASTISVLIFCAVFIPVMLSGGCVGSKHKTIKDYYEEYSFELPFKHTIGNNQYTTLYFKTRLTMEQMCESINTAGYKASLYNYDNINKIFIVARKNEFSYYYVICNKIYVDGAYVDGYVLSDCSSSLSISANSKERNQYVFLFPLHLSDTVESNPNRIKINSTFDEFVDFFASTGKNDAQIDYENKSVIFSCRESANDDIDKYWINGNIVMLYTESETGNYINLSLPLVDLN
ncbi:MAG: hypothetical protein LBU04_04965 [Christensenellaceae bacterium]|jgi:hypothetical protein|nr:hypothetical protein [Christensenellaceae bacterium]